MGKIGDIRTAAAITLIILGLLLPPGLLTSLFNKAEHPARGI